MRKKVITSAVIILILSIILLLINHYKGHNSIAAPEITLVYAENQVEDYPTTKGAYEFARLVNERTNGRIKIVVKCNGEYCSDKIYYYTHDSQEITETAYHDILEYLLDVGLKAL